MAMNQAIDVTPEQRETILSLLSRHLPDTEAWAYGSRVRWTSRPESDLDMVVFTKPEQARGVSDLREAFEESNLPLRVDLFVWDEVPESFRGEIERKHVVLVCGKAKQAPLRASLPRRGPNSEDEWRESTWGKEVVLEYGKALRGYDTAAGKYRVFGSNGPIGWTDKALAPGPGVILGRKGAYRGVQYWPDPFFVIDTAYMVVSKFQHEMRWLYYAVKHYKLGKIDDGSPIPSTTRAAVYPCKLLVPPSSEQRVIAHILGTLDDKIELNRRMNETLEAMARAIFKDWFVNFGPTHAKMEGSEPYLPPEIWGLFPDALDNEGKPEGWEFDTLARLAATNRESWTTRHHPPVVEYLALSNAKWGNVGTTTFLDWEDAPSRARRIAKAGDTIVGTTRPGNGSFAYISRDGLTASTGFAVLSPLAPKYRDAVYLAATSTENIRRLASLAYGHGGTYPAIKPVEVSDTAIVFPGDNVLAAFARLMSPVRERAERSKTESHTLTQTRDLLLPKLVSGEIRLHKVENLVGEACTG